jgi:hypothetical protein
MNVPQRYASTSIHLRFRNGSGSKLDKHSHHAPAHTFSQIMRQVLLMQRPCNVLTLSQFDLGNIYQYAPSPSLSACGTVGSAHDSLFRYLSEYLPSQD